MKKTGGKPSKLDHLKPETLAWLQEIQGDYVLEPHHARLLILAAEAWDRCQQAREVIDREGLTYVDRFGSPKSRPEISIERDGRLAFARLIRELNLDIDEPAGSRIPRLVG